ncbi:hypothetical protein ACI2IX_20060 [Leifsonia aquatica]|uniref:hypothetical protein n=1 Tax=Leifsonia aquatica TaxID=144185 RepID=UPI00384C45E9
MKRHLTSTIGAALLLTLTGCASSATSTTAPAPTVTVAPWATTAPTAVATAAPDPAQPVGQLDAAAFATSFMTAYLTTGGGFGPWYAGIHPFLSPYAATGYQNTDPAVIPAHQITGPAELVSSDDASAVVNVPTDAGTYQVLLTRPAPELGWEMDRAIPPAGSR